jgi:hypothetical protein
MRVFEVYLNARRLCTAGIGGDGVLNTMVDHVKGNGHDEVALRVGGLISAPNEHVIWSELKLKVGDEVRIKIVDSDVSDQPKERYRGEFIQSKP